MNNFWEPSNKTLDLINKEFIDLYKKAEKLSAATFIVADMMHEGQDLKIIIKKVALDILSKSLLLKEGLFGKDLFKNISELESSVMHLMSLLEISFVSGMTSEMNTSILKEEFNNFIQKINKFSLLFKNCAGMFLKNDSFQKTKSESVFTGLECNLKIENGYKSTRRETRSKTILDIVLSKGPVSIKDITSNVKGCSEKTIQRELLKLIEEGSITKIGERRWSKYMATTEIK